MERSKELRESARIERVQDVLKCPADPRKAPLSVTENFMAMLRQRVAEIEANLGSAAFK
jgi:hypothetical protein